jgi:hypothetical protein
MTDQLSIRNPAPVEVLGRRMQQALQVILAGLDERDGLIRGDMEALRRDLRMLLQQERIQIVTAEIDRAALLIKKPDEVQTI